MLHEQDATEKNQKEQLLKGVGDNMDETELTEEDIVLSPVLLLQFVYNCVVESMLQNVGAEEENEEA